MPGLTSVRLSCVPSLALASDMTSEKVGPVTDAMLELRVKRIIYEAEGINAYELIAPSGNELVPFTAGSHIALHPSNGMIRSYSLTNDQDERHRYVIAVNKDTNGRGGSAF